LTYKFDLNKNNIQYRYFNDELNIRDAKASDIERLQIISEDCFWNYGHYFADAKLNRQDCMDVYKDWTKRAVLDKSMSDKFLVALKDGNIIGYLFLKIGENENEKFRWRKFTTRLGIV
jgi:hypothetical protein